MPWVCHIAHHIRPVFVAGEVTPAGVTCRVLVGAVGPWRDGLRVYGGDGVLGFFISLCTPPHKEERLEGPFGSWGEGGSGISWVRGLIDQSKRSCAM